MQHFVLFGNCLAGQCAAREIFENMRIKQEMGMDVSASHADISVLLSRPRAYF